MTGAETISLIAGCIVFGIFVTLVILQDRLRLALERRGIRHPRRVRLANIKPQSRSKRYDR